MRAAAIIHLKMFAYSALWRPILSTKIDILEQEMSDFIAPLHHNKDEAKTIDKMAENASYTAMLAYDTAISARHMAHYFRDIWIDESDGGESVRSMRHPMKMLR